MLLYELVDALEGYKLKYALVGGFALALHGIVRATMDVDIVLALRQADYEKAEKALESIGLQSRLPVRAEDIIKMRKEYIERRNLVAWSFVDFKNPTRQVDIIITKDVRDLRVESKTVAGHKISLITLKELLKMKEEAGRPQDLLDADKIREKLNGKK